MGLGSLRSILLKAWRTRGWLSFLLWPLAQLYGGLIRLRRHFYRKGRLKSAWPGVPTVVVGNVIVGGGGKTPLVIYLARHWQQQGLRVGVISRGYGRLADNCIEVGHNTPVIESGDEPAHIRRATGAPVFVASKRILAAEALLAAYPETQIVLCDDGLQHYALRRDLEIVVFDDRGIGNGWLLPAGPLREPWPRTLAASAEMVLHTGLHPAFKGYTSHRCLAKHAYSADGAEVPLSTLADTPVFAISAIANPDAFFDMLAASGLTLAHQFALPDHYHFRDFRLSLPPGSIVVCTEKDAVKLFGHPEFKTLLVLAVPLQFSPEQAFTDALDSKIAQLISDLPFRHGHQTT